MTTKTPKVPESIVRFRAGVDVGSTQTRLLIEGVDNDNKVTYQHQVVQSSEVGIVKDDLAAQFATKNAQTKKEIYNTLTLAGTEVPRYRTSIEVAYPIKAGTITKSSMIALERNLDDIFEELTGHQKPVWAGVGVPTEFAQTEYRDIVVGKMLPRVVNRNGQTDNRDITAAEAFFEAIAVQSAEYTKDLNFGVPLIVSIGGGTMNLYIADGAAPHDENSMSHGFAGRELVKRFITYVLEDNPDAKIDPGYAEKLLFGGVKGYENVRASISGFDKPAKVPDVKAPIDLNGVYRERNIGRALDQAVRDLAEKQYASVLELQRRYTGEVKPTTIVQTGRAGQIPGLAAWLEDALHRAHFKDAKVYNLATLNTSRTDQKKFEPNLLVAQGALEAVRAAEAKSDYRWHYLMPK